PLGFLASLGLLSMLDNLGGHPRLSFSDVTANAIINSPLTSLAEVAGALADAVAAAPANSAIWGLHLTGVAQVSGPPRTLRWRPLQARRMPAGCWRDRRGLPRPLAGHDVAVAHRVMAGGEFENPEEDQAAAARAAAVEAECELVQVALQMVLIDRALVGA